jgi:hypothetical protein
LLFDSFFYSRNGLLAGVGIMSMVRNGSIENGRGLSRQHGLPFDFNFKFQVAQLRSEKLRSGFSCALKFEVAQRFQLRNGHFRMRTLSLANSVERGS